MDKTVKNPLTVIAIFSATAEMSGAAVLPLISPEQQNLYLIFLILFPILVIFLFFLTLNFNHKVLYAPSDFREDHSFLSIIAPLTPEEKAEKIRRSFFEDVFPTPDEKISKSKEDLKNVEVGRNLECQEANLKERYIVAEKLVINKLEREFKRPVQQATKIKMISSEGPLQFWFDGIMETQDEIIAIEVKYIEGDGAIAVSNSLRGLEKLDKFAELFRENSVKRLRVILAIVVTSKGELLKKEISARVNMLDYPVELRIYNLNDLLKEYGVS